MWQCAHCHSGSLGCVQCQGVTPSRSRFLCEMLAVLCFNAKAHVELWILSVTLGSADGDTISQRFTPY